MEHDIFLSYSRADTNLMKRISNDFRGRGLVVWTDEGIEPGEHSWRLAIENAILDAGCLVCILSPDSAKSRWVRAELDFADLQGKPIYLILGRGDERQSVPFGFASFQWADIRDESQYSSQIKRLTDTLLSRLNHAKNTNMPLQETRDRDEDYQNLIKLANTDDYEQLQSAKMAWNAYIQIHGEENDPYGIAERLKDVELSDLPPIPPRKILQRISESPITISPASFIKEIQEQVLDETTKIENDANHIDRIVQTSVLPKINLGDLPAPPQIENKILPAPFCWCEIPAGKTIIKYTNDSRQTFYIPQFYISQFPITTIQYQAFLDDPDGYHDEDWWNYSQAAENWRAVNHSPKRATTAPHEPRTGISWYEAVAFCLWLTDHLGLIDQMIMLPTEHQWQRAAQGDDGRLFPWGNTFNSDCANTKESGNAKLTSVQHYVKGMSRYNVMDLIGNADEWCLTEFISSKNIMTGSSSRVLRGGSFKETARYANCESRSLDGPIGTSSHHGFRVVFTRILKGL